MVVQDAGEDEVGERDGVLGGLADGVGQVPAVEAFVECAAEGVQEEDRSGFLGTVPERFVGGVRQLAPWRVAGDLDTAQAQAEGVVEGFDGVVRVLEWD
jgi:hypothetical protein